MAKQVRFKLVVSGYMNVDADSYKNLLEEAKHMTPLEFEKSVIDEEGPFEFLEVLEDVQWNLERIHVDDEE